MDQKGTVNEVSPFIVYVQFQRRFHEGNRTMTSSST